MARLEDVLGRIAQQGSGLRHDTIPEWCWEYPEIRESLVRFFIRWTVTGQMPSVLDFAREERIANRILNDLGKHERLSAATADMRG